MIEPVDRFPVFNLQNLIKKRQITYIAPLQPPTLAAFRPWGGSAGAGRVRPAAGKDRKMWKCVNLCLQMW